MSPAVARRAWAEPRVRLWWVTALALVGVGFYVAATEIAERHKEAQLIRRGTPVVATVVSANWKNMHGNSQPGDSLVQLGFDWQGHAQQVTGYLVDRPPAQFIKVDEKVDILVDPDNPGNWTSRHHPPPLFSDLGLPLAVLGLAGIVGGASWTLRRRALHSYRLGERRPARVIGRFRSALAPRAWAARCVLIEGDDRRIYTVYVPPPFPSEPGETLDLILPPPAGGGYRPLAAAWFGS